MENTEYEDFKEYLSIQNPLVLKNIQEVTSVNLNRNYMLHIDVKTPKYFIPMMPRRAALDEDNTIPRVTVADSLIGCLLAYYTSVNDVLSSKTFNGYYINILEYEYCIKPNSKLVFDAESTGEHWLLAYSKKTLKYIPKTIGKMFFSVISFNPNTKQGHNNIFADLYICIDEDIEIMFDCIQKLKKGFYKVNIDLTNLNAEKSRLSIHDTNCFKITTISEDAFKDVKNISASTLNSMSENIPLFRDW